VGTGWNVDPFDATVQCNPRQQFVAVHTTVFSDTPKGEHRRNPGDVDPAGPFQQPGDVFLTPGVGLPDLHRTADRPRRACSARPPRSPAAALRAARTPLRPLTDAIRTLATMNAVRAQCDITYPSE